MAINEHGLAELGCTEAMRSRFHAARVVLPHVCFCSDRGLHNRGGSWAGTQRDRALCVLREAILQSLTCTDFARVGAGQWCFEV